LILALRTLRTISRQQWLLITFSALCIALAFHPIDLYFLAWGGFIPLLFAIRTAKPGQTFLIGVLFGFMVALISLFWLVFLQIEMNIKLMMIFGLFLLFLYYGIYYGVALLISKKINLWLFPFLLCGLEFIRGSGEIGFPWLALGYSQARYPIIIQQASIYGVYGVSLWLAFVNILLYKALCMKKPLYWMIATVVFALPCVFGLLEMRDQETTPVHVGVIQPNIDPNLKFTRAMREETFDRLIRLSETCAADFTEHSPDNLDLIIWPETAIPVFLTFQGEHQQRVVDLCDRIAVPIFTGTPIYQTDTKDIYNGAVLITPGQGIVQEYRKIHLVPFGEHIPYDQYIPLFRNIDVGGGDYRPGNEYTVFSLPEVRFSCLICFESIFPELGHRFTKQGAQMLVNITNDGWFGKISGPHQHNDMFILRAVENRVPLARSSNTGISMLVDAYGRILHETPLFEKTYIAGTIELVNRKTLFHSIGNILPVISLIIVTCTLVLYILRQRRVMSLTFPFKRI
jgi:apolipoprotein N-acyltransferase